MFSTETLANGQTSVISSSSTATSLQTVKPDSNKGSGGLSSSSKKIIGGVVGGVGGAALLAAIFFVLLRQSRKNKVAHDNLDYDIGTGQPLSSSGADKQTLASDEAHADRYTANSRPNAAANF